MLVFSMNMKSHQHIGERIREMRKEYGLTQRELADRMGMKSWNNLSNLEKGHKPVSDKMLMRIFTDGFDLPKSEANRLIGEWRAEEYAPEYLSASSISKTVSPNPLDQIGMGLRKLGWSKKEIEQHIRHIQAIENLRKEDSRSYASL